MLRKTKIEVDKVALTKAIFVVIVGGILGGLFSAWLLMLLLGMFAGYLGVPGLALGFWATYGIFLMTRLIWFRVTADTD